ncbi:UTRA domain-containing protein [Collinsella tanakaei]|uniref:UTRA domain-containing protein n=1 Tax=Collinsella TaxID=102106 RepID=UPI0008351760|nr:MULTISPECIES: UTRA domain-containing protein [Collinsella]MBM6687467.1 UTRA domain-containing protein [Collinsella tanakaei]MBM6785219.1 UTRA domain-containing protein [Collinsella tanakaei]MBM6905410.1 UTRA domain-containing protein [Collinsella tanakaei]OUO60525.1 GntR family transcriptional regulator [Collinsella sp. An271]
MKARYDAIFRDLRDTIEDGTYPFQSFLPSEAELTRYYTCSHNTLRRALGLLREQGYVQPVHGKGVRVVFQKTERETFSVGQIESFREAGRRSHFRAETRVVDIHHLTATEQIATAYGFEEGVDLTYVERVRVIHDEALIRDCSLFLTEVVPDITEDIARSSIYEYMEHTLGITIAMSKRTITGERANERDRALLDLDGVDYLAVVDNRTFDAQGILIECTQSRHRLDHFRFRDTAVRQKV